MKITRKQLKNLIKEWLGKIDIKKVANVTNGQTAAPFGSGMEQAKLDKEQKKIIGHT